MSAPDTLLTDEEIDLIAADGMRNAAGGIYATSVYDFARAVEQAVLEHWPARPAQNGQPNPHSREKAVKAVEQLNQWIFDRCAGGPWRGLEPVYVLMKHFDVDLTNETPGVAPSEAWTIVAPDGRRWQGESAFKVASVASRETRTPEQSAALLESLRVAGEAADAQMLAEHEHLNCPACGGSGHIDDALASAPSIGKGAHS